MKNFKSFQSHIIPMPRRKYGRLVKSVPSPPPPHKCRACRNGYDCPVHEKKEQPAKPFNKMEKHEYKKLKLKKKKK